MKGELMKKQKFLGADCFYYISNELLQTLKFWIFQFTKDCKKKNILLQAYLNCNNVICCKDKGPLAKSALYLPDHRVLMMQETEPCALVSSRCRLLFTFQHGPAFSPKTLSFTSSNQRLLSLPTRDSQLILAPKRTQVLKAIVPNSTLITDLKYPMWMSALLWGCLLLCLKLIVCLWSFLRLSWVKLVCFGTKSCSRLIVKKDTVHLGESHSCTVRK